MVNMYIGIKKVVREILPAEYSGINAPLLKTKILLVKQRRGHYFPDKNIITIPLWALEKDKDYFLWYVAHEISHAVACKYGSHGHDYTFYKSFKVICPQNLQHYELGYKPRNAASAGIKQSK